MTPEKESSNSGEEKKCKWDEHKWRGREKMSYSFILQRSKCFKTSLSNAIVGNLSK
jgi:hypothetical protein